MGWGSGTVPAPPAGAVAPGRHPIKRTRLSPSTRLWAYGSLQAHGSGHTALGSGHTAQGWPWHAARAPSSQSK
eukprot:7387686-Prymnesium_polylepis.3